MHEARKRRLWEASGRRCACGAEVPMTGPGATYDHGNQLVLSEDDSEANMRPLCDPCRKAKDAADARARGKVRRLARKHQTPATDAPSWQLGHLKRKITSRGFAKGHRPIPKRVDPWGKRP